MNTSGRRRAQAVNKYRHIAKQRRPNYPLISAEKSKNRLLKLIAGERARSNKKGSK